MGKIGIFLGQTAGTLKLSLKKSARLLVMLK